MGREASVNKERGINIPAVFHEKYKNNIKKWEKEARPYLKEILQREEYGRLPEYNSKNTTFNVVSEGKCLNLSVVRKQIEITVNYNGNSLTFNAYMFLPAGKNNVPVFLNISRDRWMSMHVQRGDINEHFPMEHITGRGFGVVYFSTDDIAYEDLNDFTHYQTALFKTLDIDKSRKDDLGAIGLWSFAAMRVMDYLETDGDVDSTKVAVVGHSRLGKTALLTGAMDERFALVISNNSGCAGAAIFRGKEGEHVLYMAETIPYWFCQNYLKYVNKEHEMPFDQHYLLSLVAPRPLYIASSETDSWADPRAEFTSAYLASEIYEKVYGLNGLESGEFPKLNEPMQKGHVAYHVKSGDHSITRYDWDVYMDYAKKQFNLK